MRLLLPALLLSLALAGSAAQADEPHPRTAPAESAAAGIVERHLDPRLLPLSWRVDAAMPQGRQGAGRAAKLSFPQPNARQSVGLMIGGGAAVVAGAVVGGNVGGVLAAGGVVAGFYGLYHYLTRDDRVPAAHAR
jgi:hypothetical protein